MDGSKVFDIMDGDDITEATHERVLYRTLRKVIQDQAYEIMTHCQVLGVLQILQHEIMEGDL